MEEPVRGETTGLAAGIKSANTKKKKHGEKYERDIFLAKSSMC